MLFCCCILCKNLYSCVESLVFSFVLSKGKSLWAKNLWIQIIVARKSFWWFFADLPQEVSLKLRCALLTKVYFDSYWLLLFFIFSYFRGRYYEKCFNMEFLFTHLYCPLLLWSKNLLWYITDLDYRCLILCFLCYLLGLSGQQIVDQPVCECQGCVLLGQIVLHFDISSIIKTSGHAKMLLENSANRCVGLLDLLLFNHWLIVIRLVFFVIIPLHDVYLYHIQLNSGRLC